MFEVRGCKWGPRLKAQVSGLRVFQILSPGEVLCICAWCICEPLKEVPGLNFGVSEGICACVLALCVSSALGVLGAEHSPGWVCLLPRVGPTSFRVARVSEVLRVPGCVGGWRVGRDPRRTDGGGERRAGPGAGRAARVGGGAARQPHFGEVGGAEAGPGRARSPGKEGGGRREGRGRPPWARGPRAAAASA